MLNEQLEAPHFGLYQASSVITAPEPPDGAAKAPGGMDGAVSGRRDRGVFQPWPRVLARRYNGAGGACRDSGEAAPCVIVTVSTDLADRPVIENLVQQFRQHERVTDPAYSHSDGPDVQRIPIDPRMNLAPLARLVCPMFLSEPVPFALAFDPGAVDQEVQGAGAMAIGDGDVQTLLKAAERAEVRQVPVGLRPARPPASAAGRTGHSASSRPKWPRQ